MHVLKDNYGRCFCYLRLSVTDLCNFNCKYCLPDDVKFKSKKFLSTKEIFNLISAFSELGISKVRITGGEPTLRKDLLDIGRAISSFSGIKSLVITTNGYKLVDMVKKLYKAGFNGVNISLDTLNCKKFYMITDRDYFKQVYKGVFLALETGFSVKINVVLSNFFSFKDFESFYALLKYKKITVRFIDQMETRVIKKQNNYIKSSFLLNYLNRNGWKFFSKRGFMDGPALLFKNKYFLGDIGIINPYSKNFCLGCNRLRISSFGDLFLCLFGSEKYSLRSFLDSYKKKNILKDFLFNTIRFKFKSHFLNRKNFGIMNTFSSIGG